jgi:hypothetical protein
MTIEREWSEIQCNLKLNHETLAMLEKFKVEWGYSGLSVTIERILKELLAPDSC